MDSCAQQTFTKRRRYGTLSLGSLKERENHGCPFLATQLMHPDH